MLPKRCTWIGGPGFLRLAIGLALSALVSPSHAAPGDWTLTKSASPATYSTAGQVINYTYVITNHRASDGHFITFTDTKVAAINCPTNVIPNLGTLTCTGSYTTTAADVGAGSVTNTAVVSGDSCNDGCITTASATATVTFVAPPPPPPAGGPGGPGGGPGAVTPGSITIVKTAIGGNQSFSFASSVPGASTFSVLTVAGSATRVFANLTPGAYSVTEVNLPLNWSLSALSCSGDTGGAPTTVSLGARSVSIGLDAGENIVCTFTNTFNIAAQSQQTADTISRFLANRVQLLAGNEPDRSQFLRRVQGSLWGESGASGTGGSQTTPFSFSGSDGLSSSQLSFATSTTRIAQAHEDAEAKGSLDQLMAFAGGTRVKPRRPAALPANGIDIWVEAHFSQYKADMGGVGQRGHFGIVYLGADYLLTPSLLVGALVQYDWTAQTAQGQPFLPAATVDGRGAMAGPYISGRITQNIFFDARAAWGLSGNKVNPFGQYEDRFATSRWLAHANLTGNWVFGAMRITPSAGLTYVEERQRAYTDALNVGIPGQSVALGRFAFGPEIGYRIFGAGVIYEPHVALKGIWDFQRPDVRSVDGLLVAPDEFHAKAEAGVIARSLNGISLRTVFSYDGLGSNNFRDIGGQVWLNIPLH